MTVTAVARLACRRVGAYLSGIDCTSSRRSNDVCIINIESKIKETGTVSVLFTLLLIVEEPFHSVAYKEPAIWELSLVHPIEVTLQKHSI